MKKIILFLFFASFFTVFLCGASGLGFNSQPLAFAEPETAAVPEACKSSEKEFEDTCYSGNNVSYIKQVNALKKIKACLKNEGFSENKIKETLVLIKKNASERGNKELSKN